MRRAQVVVTALLALVLAYFAAAAALLRFDLDRLLFPASAAPDEGTPAGVLETLRVSTQSNAGTMLVRRFGAPRAGCVVYFPGQHGGLEADARELFAPLAQAGFAVYAATYPGQDGAPGRASVAEIQALGVQAATLVQARCGATRTVVAGRSLGGMVAAYAAGANDPAGLVLVSTSPSLSAGVRAHLREHWWQRPLAALPIGGLLPHDYALGEAIPSELHVVIFQGDADEQTPIADLWPDGSQPAHPPIVDVPGGTHADTLARARPAVIATMLDMIRGAQAQAARGGEAD